MKNFMYTIKLLFLAILAVGSLARTCMKSTAKVADETNNMMHLRQADNLKNIAHSKKSDYVKTALKTVDYSVKVSEVAFPNKTKIEDSIKNVKPVKSAPD